MTDNRWDDLAAVLSYHRSRTPRGLTDPEVFAISAVACGYTVDVDPHVPGLVVRALDGGLHRWDPFINDSQRWQCVRKLLEMGDVEIYKSGRHQFWFQNTMSNRIWLDCPAEEFPARALAKIGTEPTSGTVK